MYNKTTPAFIFYSQTSNQRVDGPAEPGPVAAVQHPASAYPRPDHTAPSDALFAHIARVRQSRNSGSAHGHTGESSHSSFFFFFLFYPRVKPDCNCHSSRSAPTARTVISVRCTDAGWRRHFSFSYKTTQTFL